MDKVHFPPLTDKSRGRVSETQKDPFHSLQHAGTEQEPASDQLELCRHTAFPEKVQPLHQAKLQQLKRLEVEFGIFFPHDRIMTK